MIASIVAAQTEEPVDNATMALLYGKDVAKLQGMAETVFAAMRTLQNAEAGVRRVQNTGFVGMRAAGDDVIMQERVDETEGQGEGEEGRGEVQMQEDEEEQDEVMESL